MSSDKFLYLDLSGVMERYKELQSEIEQKLDLAAKSLTAQAHSHIVEEASERLHSRREMFTDPKNLYWEPIDDGLYAVTISEEIRWIEDGMEPHEMLEQFLKSPKAKTAKDGSKYLVIPFKHSKTPKNQTVLQKLLTNQIKKELSQRNIPYRNIERNADGSPKMGLLHSFNTDKPGRQHGVQPPQQGPAGRHFQADPTPHGREGPGGRPYLWGVRVYQTGKMGSDGKPLKDQNGHQQVERSVFTFRVASSKHRGTGKWFHPGLKPMNFIDEAFEWAKDKWDNEIAPEILSSLNLK